MFLYPKCNFWLKFEIYRSSWVVSSENRVKMENRKTFVEFGQIGNVNPGNGAKRTHTVANVAALAPRVQPIFSEQIMDLGLFGHINYGKLI